MATKKISELTALTSPDGAEELLINDGGTSKKITIDNIFNQDIDVTGSVTADGADLDGAVVINESGADVNFRIETSGNENMIFVDGGEDRVGIGTGTPNVTLHLKSTADNQPHVKLENYQNADTDDAAVLEFYLNDETTGGIGDNTDVGVIRFTGDEKDGGTKETYAEIRGVAKDPGSGAGNRGNLSFFIQEDGSLTETLTLDEGNVGIGTDDPSYPFHLATTEVATIAKFESNGANSAYIDFDADTDRDIGLRLCEAGTPRWTIWSKGSSGTNQLEIADDDGAVRLRINQDGNVGIGVTPEAWHSAHLGLQFGGLGVLQANKTQSAGVDVNINSNSYVNTSGQNAYIVTDEATNYQMVNGEHIFKVAASGTADDPITFTTAMVINNNGSIDIADFSTSGATPGWNFNISGTRAVLESSAAATTATSHLGFYNANGNVGGVQTTDSATSFNTSSDYRLKENVVPMTGSIDRLKELNPSRFNFIANADKTVDGFLAHEAQEVVPEAITGEKDAMQTEEYTVSEALGEVFTPAVEEVTEERQVTETVETGSYVNLAGETITETQEVGVTEEATETVIERQDIDGVMTEVEVEKVTQEPVMETVVTTEAVAEVILETDVEKPEELTEGQWRETTAKVTAEREVPDMQGIDQGKLVPLLVGALQEAIARIETLENT